MITLMCVLREYQSGERRNERRYEPEEDVWSLLIGIALALVAEGKQAKKNGGTFQRFLVVKIFWQC